MNQSTQGTTSSSNPPPPGNSVGEVIYNSHMAPGVVVPVNNENVCVRNVSDLNLARLPEIPLPVFHSDVFKWLTFRDRFIFMVDKRLNITEINTFYNLTGCLRDKALEAIAGIPVCGSNYQLAWATLTA